MSRRWLFSPTSLIGWSTRLLLLLSACVAALLFAPHSGAQGTLKVDESKITVLLAREPTEVSLPIENLTSRVVRTHIYLELIDPLDRIAAQADRIEDIAGAKTISISIPFFASKLKTKDRSQLPWLRLRYRLTDETSSLLAAGTLALSHIAPELFDIRLATTYLAREGSDYRARVQAVNPATNKAVSGVNVQGEVVLENDNGDVHLKAYGNTDANGYAILSFPVPTRFPQFPHELRPAGGEIKVTARYGALVVETSGDVLVDQFPRILITTDKPIYQPGQTLHVRALVFSPSRKVLANEQVTLKIYDNNNMVAFQSTLTSSRFGVVSTEWPISASTRLGPYSIRLSLSNEDDDWYATSQVMVSRYELPNFSVNVQPDRKYYLAGQNAKVKVRADYLFGRPVTRAHVRVVRESDRHWNYDEQKWDADEGETFEGDTDANGIFTASIDLTKQHKQLSDSYDSDRFDDSSYAAYVTDLSSNRTEQRRFDLRVTREPLHVYLIQNKYYYDEKGVLPVQWYVSTFYADGSPAQCAVDLNVYQGDEEEGQHLKLRTNRLGLGKIPPLKLSPAWAGSEVDIALSARDSRGNKGTANDDVRSDDEELLNIQTNKTLYRQGEPITAVIEANFADDFIIVDLANANRVFKSERIKLRNGRAQITFPFSPQFKDKLTIAAYHDHPTSNDSIATHTILYPRNRDLKVEAQPVKTTYRPGETAEVALQIKTPNAQVSESALGVVVIDQAVEERVRTDREFGNNYASSYQAFFGDDEQIAGVTLNAIRRLDMSKPVPRDLELAAEMILNGNTEYVPRFLDGDTYETGEAAIFSNALSRILLPVKDALARRYLVARDYPREETTLRRILDNAGIDFSEVRDPWGVPFQPTFAVNRDKNLLTLTSAGLDKRLNTNDDFIAEQFEWPYFLPVTEAINSAVFAYHKQTRGLIRDQSTLNAEVAKAGISLPSLRDPWGTPYRFKFGVALSSFTISVQSAGPDRVFVDQPSYGDDDFLVSSSSIDYFTETRADISAALTRWATHQHPFPIDQSEFTSALQESRIDLAKILDPFGHPYEVKFRMQTIYTDKVKIESNGTTGASHTAATPVTQALRVISLGSLGADGQSHTKDDFEVATFNGVVSEEAATAAVKNQLISSIVMADNAGAIAGFITDPNGAAIAGAQVSATSDSRSFVASSTDNGSYIISNLQPGSYTIDAEAPGFKKHIATGVFVTSSTVTTVNIVLEIGATTETVSVTASAPVITTCQIEDLPINGRSLQTLNPRVNIVTKSGTNEQSFTPRLREYFPETLLWQPELTTDKQGRAHLNFKLADNITTWKLSVIGSNENGEVGTAQTEIRAFQPFFAELDPPRVLTEGDRISLPVVLRNYLDHKQSVALEIQPENWFTLLEGNRKRADVPAGDSSTQTFDLRAIASIENGKQRVTAIGSDSSDAIEKIVTVHPDGEERTDTTSDILQSTTSLAVNIPADVVRGSAHAELKIYPNLAAHVWESVEGIMQRPYGCAEQTISSSYPSLLVLQFMKESDKTSPLAAKARRYVEAGYQKLLGYQSEDGGFTYWGRGEPDIALTAYALRFLQDSARIISVDKSVIENAESWLLKKQRLDGSWPAVLWDHKEDQRRSAMVTALVARSLVPTLSANKDSAFKDAIARALTYLNEQSGSIDEPYLIASYSLAASLAGHPSESKAANDRLRKLAHSDSGVSYWALETNTPFYGWGTAGRVETTAIALQALLNNAEADDLALRKAALLFLLRNKDRYGVWYSTQATVNVLEAMLSFLNERSSSPESSSVEVIANGRVLKTLSLPADDEMRAPQIVDLSTALSAGANRIELRAAREGKTASVEVVTNYYVPWKPTANNESARVRSGDAEALRLETYLDKQESRVMDEITCHVKAERIGFRGYGMLLAEIGLPPGADVDRASLEAALRESDWTISQYDVLPDRVVVYLWPRAGGSEFKFKFRPRIAMTAKAAASSVYDYYNPEAKAVVAPRVFVVR